MWKDIAFSVWFGLVVDSPTLHDVRSEGGTTYGQLVERVWGIYNFKKCWVLAVEKLKSF